jgi:hypothetical protein
MMSCRLSHQVREYQSGSRVKIWGCPLRKIPAQASVCLYFNLSGQEFDIKELVWTGRLAELELFPASHPAQLSWH